VTVSVTASTVSVIDNFEDNDLSEYSGATGDFSTVTSPVKEGTYALQADGSTGSIIKSFSGLNNYPSRGDTVRYWLYIPGAGVNEEVPVFHWAKQGNGGEYQFSVRRGSENEIQLAVDSGGFSILDTTSYTFPSDTWMEIEIDFQSTITCRVLDDTGTLQASVSATDSTYDSGGIGFVAGTFSSNSTERVGIWDNVRII